jgi:undecaprenyl-diphosphatase
MQQKSMIISKFKYVDEAIFKLVNVRMRRFHIGLLMATITYIGSPIFAIPYITILVLLRKFPGIQLLSIVTFINCFIGQLIVQSTKRIVDRRRPYISLNFAVTGRIPSSRYSFPSGHTCAAFCMAIPFITLQFPLIVCIIAILIAFTVGISRIYIGVHYPTDVMFGIIAAIIASSITRLVINISFVNDLLNNIFARLN